MKIGPVLCNIMIVFMIFNMAVSAFAMARYSVRNTTGAEASTGLDMFMDEHFPDERMERIYPNAIIVEDF